MTLVRNERSDATDKFSEFFTPMGKEKRGKRKEKRESLNRGLEVSIFSKKNLDTLREDKTKECRPKSFGPYKGWVVGLLKGDQ